MFLRNKSLRNTANRQAEKQRVEAWQCEAFKLQETEWQCITESFLIWIYCHMLIYNHTKADEIKVACSIYGIQEKCVQNWNETHKENKLHLTL